ncbi:MAG TPA: DUF6599 family protein [Bacteroidales bacterium]|nr:DUF6599 family protein [Bacteroidales bacterium]
MKKLLLLLVVALFTIHGRAAGTKLFPEIQGWKMKINDHVYNSGDLWELIDGAADIFLSYYFEDLHIAEYSKKNQMIRVELYRHKTADDTYGIYTSERMPDYTQLPIGSQGYKSEGILNFLAGNYYVKVMSAGVDAVDEQTIAMVAEKVNATLAQPVGLPSALKYFPPEGQVPLSDTYIAQNFLGYSCFHHAFSVKYNQPSDFQVFIIKLTPEAIQQMVDQYVQIMKEDKVQKKDSYIIVNDMFNGTVFLKQKADYLIGVLNTNNEETAVRIMKETESRIQ